MSFSDKPNTLAEYRETTLRDKTSCIGFIRFRCKKCRTSKPTGGSKKNTPYGWICSDCKIALGLK